MLKILCNYFLCLGLGLTTALATTVLAHEITGDPAKYVSQTLSISGAVEKPLVLTVEDLQKFPALQIKKLAITRQHGGVAGKLENLKGVRLGDLLDKAVIISRDHNDVKKTIIIATATDDYKVVYSWSEIFNTAVGEGVLVFFEKDGKDLPDDEGRIAMLSTKDLRTGPRHVKWLKSIEVKRIGE